jgi:MYXO-CTERM domain-containing protein
MRVCAFRTLAAPACAVLLVFAMISPVAAAPYTVAYSGGGTWNDIYAQGFSTSLGASPAPGLANGAAVYLNQFQFFKSGSTDNTSNFQLAIFNTMYPNTVGLTTGSSSFVGLSTNTIAGTTSIALNAPISFNFNSLPLVFGNDYSAVFVNVGAGGALTPALVPGLTANYAMQADNNFHPVTNYGTETQFQYTTTNFINAGFFSAFSFAGDANFTASLTTTPLPEPSSLVLGLIAVGLLGLTRRRHSVP